MEIGDPIRVIEVERSDVPVPQELPDPDYEPQPELEPVEEPVQVPA
jgi:hypothetical protein